MWIKKEFILILLVLLVSSSTLFSGEPAVIVTVDGLSFVKTLLPGLVTIEENDNYLYTALEKMNLDLPDTTIIDFAWSRDAGDTLTTVEDLRIFLLEKYQQAKSENKRFIVVAHSWGTVLTYLALSLQSSLAPEIQRVYVDLYITLGSPLGTGNAHAAPAYPEETIVINYTANWVNQYNSYDMSPPLAEDWVNYWAWGDVISGPLHNSNPGAGDPLWQDIQIDTLYSLPGYAGRNTSTTIVWHKYDSLQPGGVIDNQPLLDEVKSRIEGPTDTGEPPFGSLDTPLEGSSVSGSIPVTGWALDETGVESVKIYLESGGNLVYIGEGVFIEGARPDIETAYPGYPNNNKAGWGYMMLTHFLPNGGNGLYTFHAIASDVSGQQVTLGTTTVFCDNANAVKPFGAIDTPAQGGIASGRNFVIGGWVLTPGPNSIPTDGTTINVYVDGVYLGHPAYNIYRSDIAALFPGYANSNGAGGIFYLDTTAYENGVHTIYWTVEDDAGNIEGIGSRFFIIRNTGSN